jgi:hypothetical protein
MSFSIGADPELFAQDATGVLRSCIGIIGGTKEEPRWLDDHKSLGVQEDNVAAEYCFSPCYNEEQFVQAIQLGQAAIQSLLGTKNLVISNKASHSFMPEELEHPMAQVFGCDPDFNAWELRQNDKPVVGDKNFRTCGGHIHVGVVGCDSPMEQVRLTKLMDLHLGLWSVIEDPDTQRRALYGAAGCFRPKPYGIEYRSLSNYWIFSKLHSRSIYNRTSKAVGAFFKGDNVEEERIKLAINTCDRQLAHSLIQSYGI